MAQKIGHHLWMFNYARVPQLELGFNVQNNPLCTERGDRLGTTSGQGVLGI